MGREFNVRKPTDVEKEKYLYTVKDEKDIPLGTFEPMEILEYRGYNIPVYCDDYGQQYFVRFDDDEWGNPLGDCDDFMDFIDKKLDMFIPNKTPNQVMDELNSLTYTLLKLLRADKNYSDLKIYQEAKKLQQDINTYILLFASLCQFLEPKYSDNLPKETPYLMILKPHSISKILGDQLKRVIEMVNDCNLFIKS